MVGKMGVLDSFREFQIDGFGWENPEELLGGDAIQLN